MVRGYLKPISTLRRPLESVRFDTREATSASYERSDICVVPAAGVAAEAMVALTVAGLAQQKFGGDSAAGNETKFRRIHRTDTELLSKTTMILKIVKYPEPVLSQPGEPVTEFNAELRKLVADMFETMYASQGIGLAAPQVGVSKRVTVIDLSMGKDPQRQAGAHQSRRSSSAKASTTRKKAASAFPTFARRWSRAAKVRIRAQDENGKWFEMDGEELLARAFQHEIDHLDGMLFIFRMSALKRDLNLRKIRKMQREGTW